MGKRLYCGTQGSGHQHVGAVLLANPWTRQRRVATATGGERASDQVRDGGGELERHVGQATAYGRSGPFRVSASASCTLNAMSQSRVTLSLRQEHLRAGC